MQKIVIQQAEKVLKINTSEYLLISVSYVVEMLLLTNSAICQYIGVCMKRKFVVTLHR